MVVQLISSSLIFPLRAIEINILALAFEINFCIHTKSIRGQFEVNRVHLILPCGCQDMVHARPWKQKQMTDSVSETIKHPKCHKGPLYQFRSTSSCN